jgi:hypothetical protein
LTIRHLAFHSFTLFLAAAVMANPPDVLVSRIAYAPLLVKLRAAGSDPANVQLVTTGVDLLRLKSGSRYKFSQRADGRIATAPLPADAPHNEYVHPILAGGGPVRTAGGIVVEHHGGTIIRVIVDQDSQSYCPSLASLRFALEELARIAVPRSKLFTKDRPPRCKPVPTSGRKSPLDAEDSMK